jgi:hypothetical protein
MTAPTTSAGAVKAYLVWYRDDEDKAGIYHATTASKARYQALLSALDANWEVTFADFRVRRASGYDRMPRRDRSGGVIPWYADLLLHEQQAVERWNITHPIGTPVRLRLDSGEVIETATRSVAVLRSDHAVIWLDGVVGSYSLSRVQPIEEAADA